MSARTWSAQQAAIFAWFEKNQAITYPGFGIALPDNLIVRARAGCGKTTTIIEGVNRAPDSKILVAAFNKRIADELTTRLTGGHAESKTLHGIGFGIVRRYWEGLRVEDSRNKTLLSRKDDLTERVCGQTVPDAMKRIISKLHTLAREIQPYALDGCDLVTLAREMECEPDEQWASEGWTVERLCDYAVRAMALASSEKPRTTGIDFADMIFLPVRNRWTNPAYDLVVVDEAQDMTVAQLALARGVCRGRMAIVGDDRQAVYGFRGADAGSLDRLKAELDATELGLNTTYRCGRAIVEVAARIVPDFQAGPANPEGEILGVAPGKLGEMAQPGDFVLSRTNAPLVEVAMGLLKAGKRTKIAGKDIGAGLLALVRRLAGRARTVPEFLDRVGSWAAKEIRRAQKAGRDEQKIEAIMDQAEMLRGLAEGAVNVTAIEQRIVSLFTDDGLGQAGVITCSSVHRAKGLEADRVFVLVETLKDTTIEEQNIRYVAVTRARHTLVWVGEGFGAKQEAAA